MTSTNLAEGRNPTPRTIPRSQAIPSMISPDEFASWCRKLQASDRVAYEQVFRAMHDPLLRYAVQLARSKAVARDIVHDVFVKLWHVRQTLDPDQSLKAFLYRMVRNLAYNYHRDRRNRASKQDSIRDTLSDAFARPDAHIDTQHLEDRLRGWIDELPDRQREALVLSRFEGLSHQEIASVMQVSPRTVNNHVVKAMKQLRRRVLAYEPDLLEA